jgi:hypothetical protein
MSECKRGDERGGDSVGIVFFVGLIISTIGLLLFFCFLNGLSQQAHRNAGYHNSQVKSNNGNQDAEDLVVGYLLFGGGGGRRK